MKDLLGDELPPMTPLKGRRKDPKPWGYCAPPGTGPLARPVAAACTRSCAAASPAGTTNAPKAAANGPVVARATFCFVVRPAAAGRHHQQEPIPMHRRIDFQSFEEFVVISLEKVMTDVDTLTAAVAKLQTDVTSLTGLITTEIPVLTAEISSLQAQITALEAGNPGIDLSGLIASVNTIDASVTNITSVVEAAANPVAPAATTA